jgi:hypothetical protein
MWSTLGLALLLASPDLIVRSSTSCPSAVAVVRELTPLLPPGATVATAEAAGGAATGTDRAAKEIDHADVSVGARTRWLRVRTSAGRISQGREIPASLTCDEAAKAAAVLLATWQFQGAASLPSPSLPSVTPPPQPSPPAATTIAGTRPETNPAGRSTSAGPSPPPAAGGGGIVRGRDAASTERTRDAPPATMQRLSPPAPAQAAAVPDAPWRLAIGAGFSTGRAANQFPVNAMVEVLLGRPEGVGLRAQFVQSSRYSQNLATGRATWTRSSLGVGGAFTGRREAWGGQARVEVVGALLSISGTGFGVNEDSHQLALGGTVGGRVMRGFGPADLWLDLACTAWPGRNQVFLRDVPDSLDLSTFEVLLGLGADFFVWP